MMACASLGVYADTLEDARKFLVEGDHQQARTVLDKVVASNPKSKNSAQYMYILGACELEDGNYDNAERLLTEAKKKGAAAANLYLGRLAFLNYDFETAMDFYDEFKTYQEKTKTVGAEAVKESERQLTAAENALERVERIVVIDSIALPADIFFKSYKLLPSAGRLLLPFEIPFEEHQGKARMAFVNEGGDYMMWGEPDSVGNVRLVESILLLDGTWHEPVETPSLLNKGGYADFPFMMSDGVRLYYASTGSDSMGGYDIFVASRDPQTGEYLQPQNVGMPFNSPYDDYMLAIDEENGVGWWATDRNRLGDKVTVYVYILNDLRKNYEPDSENLIEMARLTDYKATWNAEDVAQYEAILEKISAIDPDYTEKEADFKLPVGNGNYYTHYSDFKHGAAKDAMKAYLAASRNVASTERKLDGLYKRYPVNHADNVKQEILRLESELEKQRKDLINKRSDVYRLEKITK